MALSLETVTNIFHDSASMDISIYLHDYICVYVCVCSLYDKVIPNSLHGYQTITHNLSSYK